MPLATVKDLEKKLKDLVAKQYGRGIKEEEVKRLLT
jgi:hypothetical protein